MSQVIVTDDKLNIRRAKTAKQEHKIDCEGQFSRWRKNDITGRDPLTAAIGMALTPIVAFWALLTGVMVVMLGIVEFLFKGIGKVVGGTRNLITGRNA